MIGTSPISFRTCVRNWMHLESSTARPPRSRRSNHPGFTECKRHAAPSAGAQKVAEAAPKLRLNSRQNWKRSSSRIARSPATQFPCIRGASFSAMEIDHPSEFHRRRIDPGCATGAFVSRLRDPIARLSPWHLRQVAVELADRHALRIIPHPRTKRPYRQIFTNAPSVTIISYRGNRR